MIKQECGNCTYWRKKDDDRGGAYGAGYCLRFPPIFEMGDNVLNDGWPNVHQQSWCGEYLRRRG